MHVHAGGLPHGAEVGHAGGVGVALGVGVGEPVGLGVGVGLGSGVPLPTGVGDAETLSGSQTAKRGFMFSSTGTSVTVGSSKVGIVSPP
jgi:hypothetical protein